MLLFVTGSTGFIGSHFIRAALGAGHDVVALRHHRSKPVIPILESSGLTWVEGDLNSFLLDPSSFSLNASSHSLSALVHFAACGVSPQPCTWEKAFQVNVLDSILLMERAVNAGIRKIVVCGSCVEYGKSAELYKQIPPDAPLQPVGHYAASKAAQSIAASALCRARGFNLAILRLFTVFGEGQHPDNFWPSLRRAAMAGEDFSMSAGEQIRDFIPVDRVARAFLKTVKLLSEPEDEEMRCANNARRRSSAASSFSRSPLIESTPFVANIGTGRSQTLRAFAEHWWNEWGATGKLLPGALPYRESEIMRYVPKVNV